MGRALVVGDLHLSGDNLSDTEPACKDIVAYANAKDYAFVVFCGDVNHNFGVMHLACIRIMHWMIAAIRCPNIIILTGNHDRPHNKHFLTQEHPFHGLLNDPRVQVAATSVLDLTLAGKRMAFAPYVPDGRLDEAFHASGLDPDDSSWYCAFGHQLWKGCLGCPEADAHGDEWGLARCHMFSGHIHGFARFQPNLTIIGAALQHHPKDSADRAILDLDLDTLEYERLFLRSVPLKHCLSSNGKDLLDILKQCNDKDKYTIDVTCPRAELKAIMSKPAVRKILHDKTISIRPHAVDAEATTILPDQPGRLDFFDEVRKVLPSRLDYIHEDIMKSLI